jgi:hypothetical protein
MNMTDTVCRNVCSSPGLTWASTLLVVMHCIILGDSIHDVSVVVSDVFRNIIVFVLRAVPSV